MFGAKNQHVGHENRGLTDKDVDLLPKMGTETRIWVVHQQNYNVTIKNRGSYQSVLLQAGWVRYAREKKRVETNDEVFDGLVMIDGVRFEWRACSQGNQGCLYWMGFGFGWIIKRFVHDRKNDYPSHVGIDCFVLFSHALKFPVTSKLFIVLSHEFPRHLPI